MNWGNMKDAGAQILAVFGGISSALAGGTGDATEVNGAWLDTEGFESLDVALAWTAELADTESLAVIANFQDADDIAGTGVADVSTNYVSALASTTLATSDGGTTETGVLQLGVDLTMFKRFVRVQFTPDLSASGTDTADLAATYMLGGASDVPANASRVNLRA